MVLNLENGKKIKTLSIGDHVDGAAFDPVRGNLFTTNGDGTLTVIHEDNPNKYHVVATIQTEKGARTIAFDGVTGRVFTDTAEMLPTTPVAGKAKAHRQVVPGTFHLLEVGVQP